MYYWGFYSLLYASAMSTLFKCYREDLVCASSGGVNSIQFKYAHVWWEYTTKCLLSHVDIRA